MRGRSGGSAAAVAILLIGAGLAAGWLLVAPMVLGTDGAGLSGPLATEEVVAAEPTPLLSGVRLTSSLQISQPRDPFRPLISETSIIGPGNGNGFEPSGIRVRLVEIRDVDGVLRATIEVDDATFDVGVGDTFADDFFVVSLDTDSGVFLYKDNAFELQVGQEILK